MYESLGITVSEFQHFLLVFMRITALLTTAPIFSNTAIIPHFRAVLGLMLSFMLVSVLPVPADLPLPLLVLIFYAGREVLVGVLIGWVSEIVFEGVRFVGFMTARMMNLSMMTIFDPTQEEEIDVLSELMFYVAFFALLSVDGHHFFLKSLFDSFYIIPLTEVTWSAKLLPLIIKMVSSVFIVGLKIGAPIYVIMFLVQIVMALFAKITPDIQILIVGMPLTIMVGFYVLIVYWPYFVFAFLKYLQIYTTEIGGFIKLLGGG